MRIHRRNLILFAVAAILTFSVSGCGGPYDSTAHGVVTLDGKAVPCGLVGFHPVASGPPAYALIDSNGSYEVYTGKLKGLPSGDYQVSVAANENPTISQTETGGAPPPGKAITPAWYRTKQTSGLKFTLKPGKNEINLELKSEPPPGWKGKSQT